MLCRFTLNIRLSVSIGFRGMSSVVCNRTRMFCYLIVNCCIIFACVPNRRFDDHDLVTILCPTWADAKHSREHVGWDLRKVCELWMWRTVLEGWLNEDAARNESGRRIIFWRIVFNPSFSSTSHRRCLKRFLWLPAVFFEEPCIYTGGLALQVFRELKLKVLLGKLGEVYWVVLFMRIFDSVVLFHIS